MSEYQKAKARALELQRLKDQSFQLELAEKAEREQQIKREEDERRRKKEAAIKEARRLELIRANEALVGQGSKTVNGTANGNTVKGQNLEWNPFAEDEKRAGGATSLAGPSKALVRSNGNTSPRPRTVSTQKERKPTNSSSSKPREISPPALSRKEKAARAFLLQTKTSTSNSAFSVRSLVQSREANSTLSPRAPPKPNPLFPAAASTRTVLGGKIDLKRKMGKHGLGKGMNNGRDELRVLCPDRSTRDRRTIDEIQKDIVKARVGESTIPSGNSKTGSQGVRLQGLNGNGNGQSKSRSLSPTKGLNKTPKHKPPPIPSSARPIKPPHSHSQPKALSQIPRPRRARSPSSTTSSSSSSTSSPHNQNRKRPRHSPDLPSQFDISRQIQDMFRRPDRPPPGRVVYSDEEDDDDMEAGLSDVEAEERRAAALARREDEAAEREEREHRERKERLRRERDKVGKGRV